MPLKASVRNLMYQTEKLVQHARFASLPTPENGWPILLGISFPKSGTHLLDQILLGFSRVAPFSRRLHSFYAEYEGESGCKRAPEQAILTKHLVFRICSMVYFINYIFTWNIHELRLLQRQGGSP